MSVCRTGLRDLIAYSLLGSGIPIPEQRLSRDLDSVPLHLVFYFPRQAMVLVLPRPPSKILPFSLPSAVCQSPLSFLPISSSLYVSVQSALTLQQRLVTHRTSGGSLQPSG